MSGLQAHGVLTGLLLVIPALRTHCTLVIIVLMSPFKAPLSWLAPISTLLKCFYLLLEGVSLSERQISSWMFYISRLFAQVLLLEKPQTENGFFIPRNLFSKLNTVQFTNAYNLRPLPFLCLVRADVVRVCTCRSRAGRQGSAGKSWAGSLFSTRTPVGRRGPEDSPFLLSWK